MTPRPLRPCGSSAAAVRHRRAGEDLCDACRDWERRRGARRRELELQAIADLAAAPPAPRRPPSSVRPGRGSAALIFAENLDRLPAHDPTILFVARLLAPIVGQRLPTARTFYASSAATAAKRLSRLQAVGQ